MGNEDKAHSLSIYEYNYNYIYTQLLDCDIQNISLWEGDEIIKKSIQEGPDVNWTKVRKEKSSFSKKPFDVFYPTTGSIEVKTSWLLVKSLA